MNAWTPALVAMNNDRVAKGKKGFNPSPLAPGVTAVSLLQQHENQNHPAGLRAALGEPAQGPALDKALRRKEKGDKSTPRRFRVTYTVYSHQPMDYDNISVKYLQDALVKTGILQGDDWQRLEGTIKSRKAKDERTEIEIEEIIP